MQKGRAVARRAMDVLVAALVSPMCEDEQASLSLPSKHYLYKYYISIVYKYTYISII